MKKIILAALTGTMLLSITGCGSSPSAMTQEIAGSNLGDTSTAAQDSTQQANVSSSTEGLTADLTKEIEALMNTLYETEAKLDALDIKEDNLETSLRTGKITQADFDTQNSELKAAEQKLDTTKRDIKKQISGLNWDYDVPMMTETQKPLPTDKNQLISLYEEYSMQEDDLELKEDDLERQFMNGKIAEDEFIKQKIALEKEADITDYHKDLVEHELEKLGWDD